MTSTSQSGNGVLVFIPTFNDVEMLGALARKILALPGEYAVLVIDDGSTRTISTEDLGDRVLCFRIPANLGLGACTHIAFDHAVRWNYSSVVRIDADGQHPVEAVPDLLDELHKEGTDLVVAGRSNRHSVRNLRSILAILVRGYLTMMSYLLTKGRAPRDVNSGFFAITKHGMETLNRFHLERYPEPQTYVLACRRGLQVREVSIEQLSREYGSSTLTLGHAVRLTYRFSIFVLAELLQQSKIQ